MNITRKFLLISNYKYMCDVIEHIFIESDMCKAEGIDNYEITNYNSEIEKMNYDIIIIDDLVNPLILKNYNTICNCAYVIEFDDNVSDEIDIPSSELYNFVKNIKKVDIKEYIKRFELFINQPISLNTN